MPGASCAVDLSGAHTPTDLIVLKCFVARPDLVARRGRRRIDLVAVDQHPIVRPAGDHGQAALREVHARPEEKCSADTAKGGRSEPCSGRSAERAKRAESVQSGGEPRHHRMQTSRRVGRAAAQTRRGEATGRQTALQCARALSLSLSLSVTTLAHGPQRVTQHRRPARRVRGLRLVQVDSGRHRTSARGASSFSAARHRASRTTTPMAPTPAFLSSTTSSDPARPSRPRFVRATPFQHGPCPAG